jgi:mono/diheme cytochrome c family protein
MRPSVPSFTRTRNSGYLIIALTLVFGPINSSLVFAQQTPEAQVDFYRDIQPILADPCYRCHGPNQQRNGLRLDRKADALRGGDSGQPALVPGNSAESRLIQLITAEDEGERMPAEGDALTPEQINLLRSWIDQGSEWPDTDTVEPEPTPSCRSAVHST